MELMGMALELGIKGMGGIFAVLGVLSCCVLGLGRWDTQSGE